MRLFAHRYALRITRTYSAASEGRAFSAYIPQKVKEEIAALAEEDGSRWTASTLAARFGAPRENVEAVLRLWGMRRKVIGDKARLERLRGMQETVEKAWRGLPEVIDRSGPGVPERKIAAVAELEPSEGEITGVEVETEAVEEVREKSTTAKWIEQVCETAECDLSRRTTFAFIEVGDGVQEGVDRAVWIREGASGRLRLADEKERDVLLDKTRARDTDVWQ